MGGVGVYQYWVLRYVPDTLRGEFVNVGVVVGDGSNDWAIRRVQSLGRASKLGGDAKRAAGWLSRIESRFPSDSPNYRLFESAGNIYPSSDQPIGVWLESTRARLNNSVQISAPVPVAAASAREAVDRLFRVLVLDPEIKHHGTRRNQAVRDLGEAFWTDAVRRKREIQRDVKLRASRQGARFEYAIGDGRIEQLSRVVSFDRQAIEPLLQDIQAWSFAVGVLRDQGGQVLNPARKNNAVSPVANDVPIRVLYVPPTNDSQTEALRVAEDAWGALDVKAFEVGQEHHIAHEARSLLEHAPV